MTQKQEQLVLSNQNLVYQIARNYRNRPNYEDIVAEGMLGLCLAASKFDEIRGNSFTTYAYMQILGRIMVFIYNDEVVKPKRRDGKYIAVETVELTCELANTLTHQHLDEQKLDSVLYFSQMQKLLDNQQYTIVKMLYCGYKKKEILERFKMNQSQLNKQMDEIKTKLKILF